MKPLLELWQYIWQIVDVALGAKVSGDATNLSKQPHAQARAR